MIVDFLRNIAQVRRLEESLGSKVTTLNTLNRFLLLKKFSNGNRRIVHAKINGHKVYGYDYKTIDFLYREIFLQHHYKFKERSTKPVIIDCGSNIGVSVLYFKIHYPESTIEAFEANPNAFKLLERNIAENGLSKVNAHNKALWDEEKELSFYIDDNLGTLLGSVRKDRGGQKEIKIKSEKLSNVVKKYESIDLLKIDVEGAEKKLIADLNQNGLIEKAWKYIIEYHHNIEDDRSKLSEFLGIFESRGYNYIIKESYTAPDNFQDLLLYIYKPEAVLEGTI